jgi:hypothetical protein
MSTSARSTPAALDILIALLAAATALIHIWLAVPTNLMMFYLNGLGYLALAAALFLPQLAARRRLVRYALIGFTAVTVLGWVAFGERNLVGYVDKAIEVALIVLLALSLRR